MNILDKIEDKEQFVQEIKNQMNQRTFAELEKKKQELANDFIKSDEHESN